MKRILACVAVPAALLAAHQAAHGQLVLNAGDVLTYQFGPATLEEGSVLTGATVGGHLIVGLQLSTLQDGDTLRLEMFEHTTGGPPICTRYVTTPLSAPPECSVPGAWQDKQGAVRLAMLSGSVALQDFTVRVLLPGSGDEVIAFTHTVPLPAEPVLAISRVAGSVRLSWPSSATGYRLQSAGALSEGTLWQSVTNVPQTNGPAVGVTLPSTAPQQFYRLKLVL